jgi:hypothetical protein
MRNAAWLSSTCARHGRAGMVNITKRSGSTCFVCKMPRLRNIGIRMIDLDAMGSIILDRAVGLTKRSADSATILKSQAMIDS